MIGQLTSTKPLTNAERIANWAAVYRYFANDYAAEQAATAEPVSPEYETN